MILVDTSVIADVLTKDPSWFEWSSAQIEHWADQGPVCYDAIVFAELAVKFDTQKDLEQRLSAFTHLPLPLNAAFPSVSVFWSPQVFMDESVRSGRNCEGGKSN